MSAHTYTHAYMNETRLKDLAKDTLLVQGGNAWKCPGCDIQNPGDLASRGWTSCQNCDYTPYVLTLPHDLFRKRRTLAFSGYETKD